MPDKKSISLSLSFSVIQCNLENVFCGKRGTRKSLNYGLLVNYDIKKFPRDGKNEPDSYKIWRKIKKAGKKSNFLTKTVFKPLT